MRGNNEMILNELTMIEAVQEWLDKRWSAPRPKVTSVKATSSKGGYDSNKNSFTVLLEEGKEGKAPDEVPPA